MKKVCFKCKELKDYSFFTVTKTTGAIAGRCRQCINEDNKIKNIKAGRSLQQIRDKIASKYSEVVKFKTEHPEVCLADICRKFNVNYYNCRSHFRYRKIKINGSHILKIRNIGQPIHRWLRKSHLAYMRKYFKTVYAKKKRNMDIIYRNKNKDRCRSYSRNHARKCVKNFSDTYVKAILVRHTNLLTKQIPDELVLVKREQLKLHRLLTNKQ